jgi:hypothetical protein
MSGHDDEHIPARDRELGMDRPIARRDFLNGVALGIGGALASQWIPGLEWSADARQFAQDTPGYNPSALTGMRGSHDGSNAVAHALRDNRFWASAGQPINTNETYDLIVVGGGISGLTAAYAYRARTGRSARILILDNHDDFGGHAKRNEFRPGGRLWIANGGTAGISSPFTYSAEALGLMTEIGIDVPVLTAEAGKAADRSVFQGLQSSYFFDKETFGADRLVVGTPGGGGRGRGGAAPTTWPEFLAKTPLSAQAQKDVARLETDKVDYMPGLSSVEKKDQQYTTFMTVDLATDSYFGPASGIWKPDPRGGWLMTEKYPAIGMQKPSENHFDGPVYVLIDGGGFSATPAFTVLADYYKRATFIGEETGGSGSGGAGSDIGPTLPESHLHLSMSIESYFSVVDRNPRRRGTLPKYPVTQTIGDLAKGRDTVLEFTRELIRGGKGR